MSSPAAGREPDSRRRRPRGQARVVLCGGSATVPSSRSRRSPSCPPAPHEAPTCRWVNVSDSRSVGGGRRHQIGSALGRCPRPSTTRITRQHRTEVPSGCSDTAVEAATKYSWFNRPVTGSTGGATHPSREDDRGRPHRSHLPLTTARTSSSRPLRRHAPLHLGGERLFELADLIMIELVCSSACRRLSVSAAAVPAATEPGASLVRQSPRQQTDGGSTRAGKIRSGIAIALHRHHTVGFKCDGDCARCIAEHPGLGAREHGAEPLEVPSPRDFGDAERRQMIRSPLHIDQSRMVIDQAGGQSDDRRLRGVGAAMKFGLGCEQPPDPEAVQAAHEFSVAPGLDTVGPTKLVETS